MKITRFRSRALVLIVCLVMSGATSVRAQWHTLGTMRSYVREGQSVTLDCHTARMQVTVLAADLVRVRITPNRTFGPDESWAVIAREWPSVPVDVTESRAWLRLATPEVVVEIAKSPCRLTFRDTQGGLIVQDDPKLGTAWDGRTLRVWKVKPPDEYYYGLGLKAGPLEHGGHAYVNWNTDAFGYRWGSDPLYQSIPFLLALREGRSYALFLDTASRSDFDLGKAHRDLYAFGVEESELRYYFFYGPDPKKVLMRYTELVGRMPLPPRWALGYHQCRWSYEPESRVREIVRTFRMRRIPLDAIWLDIDYMDGFRVFTVDRTKFPTFRQMIADFLRAGVKTVCIINPGVKQEPGYWVYDHGVAGDHFVRMPNGSHFTGRVWPGVCVFPDFMREETRRWWGDLHKELMDAGVRGFWTDMNEPALFVETDRPTERTMALEALHRVRDRSVEHRRAHNAYGMLMARATFEGMWRLRPDERPFVLTRASGAGGHRYAATWTGDNTSSWEHLHLWIPMVLNLGLSGQPFAGPDIGGFSESPTPELYTRFLQAGVFSPFCRTHTAKGTRDQEPWSYGPLHEAINRRYIELRYQLLPYIYTAFEEATRTGIPVMRPLFLEYPRDRRTYRLDTQFLFGPDLLVAPVLIEGATHRSVYLPEGEWYNFWTGERIVGPAEISIQAPIDVLPLFVRGGAILPLQQVVQYAEEAPADPLTLKIFPAQQGTGTLYEDDGLSYEYTRGTYARTSFRLHQTRERMQLEITAREGSYIPAPRSYLLQIHALEESPSRVRRATHDLPRLKTPAELERSSEGWTYDPMRRIVWITFPDEGRAETITLMLHTEQSATQRGREEDRRTVLDAHVLPHTQRK